MKNRHAIAIHLLALCLITVAASEAADPVARGAEIAPRAFSDGPLQGWSERSFKGNTRYELVDDNGIPVLRGDTEEQASIFYREKSVDLNETPFIHWSWKVDRTFDNIDEKARAGDDFPARLYVVAKTGLLPWDTVAINYVWASESPVGDFWPNPFTDKARMLVIQSGDDDVGRWTTHTRNVAEDFKKLFNKDVDKIQGYAVMVDGDNSLQQATAWFGQISFSNTSTEQ